MEYLILLQHKKDMRIFQNGSGDKEDKNIDISSAITKNENEYLLNSSSPK